MEINKTYSRRISRIKKQLDNATFSFKCNYFFENSVLYFTMEINKSFDVQIKIIFPDSYPFRPPIVLFMDEFVHDLIKNKRLDMSEYSPALTLPTIIYNVYCILCEIYTDANTESNDVGLNKK